MPAPVRSLVRSRGLCWSEMVRMASNGAEWIGSPLRVAPFLSERFFPAQVLNHIVVAAPDSEGLAARSALPVRSWSVRRYNCRRKPPAPCHRPRDGSEGDKPPMQIQSTQSAPVRVPVHVRYLRHVERSEGCWEWLGKRLLNGYGVIRSGGRHDPEVYAHRVAWEAATGETLTSDDEIGHTCDRPFCVRNDDDGTYEVKGILLPRRGHLFKGTHGNNMADMSQKGRGSTGERHGSVTKPESVTRGENFRSARLTSESVIAMRARYAGGGVSISQLAGEYGVTQALIWGVIRRRRWRHIA